MSQVHTYIVQGVVVRGTPLDKEEFETEMGGKVASTEEEHIFLRDVALHGAQGVVELKHMILERRAVAAIGRERAPAR